MITAAETCDFINEVVCKPANVKELFEFTNFAGTQISRTEVLILLAAIIPVVVVFFGLRKKSVVPGKLQSAVESIFSFVKDEIALVVLLAPAVLSFIPGMTEYVKQGFIALQETPTYYQHLLYIAISASFGIKGASGAMKLFKKK